jgi:predicted ATPase
MELAELLEALKRPDTRLLTCLGPGGVGKTRLALQAATMLLPEVEAGKLFADGIYFVAMAAVETADQQSDFNPLVSPIADSLHLSFSASEDLIKQLQSYLREKSLLLIVDNFEHLLPAASLLTELLQAAPGLKLLITSRGRLNVRGEWTQTLSGLKFPLLETADHQQWQSYSAVQLFLQTAHTIDPGFGLHDEDEPAVSRICRLVEGLPLGVELAATWVRVLSVQEIADEIEQNIGFLASSLRDVPERHRSLRAVFDYSWNLLSAEEQQLLCQLSLFRSSFDRRAAMEVTGASLPLLAALVDSSLVRRLVPEQGQVRYELLEVLRQYVADKLAQNQQAERQARHRHCHFYLTLLAGYQADLQGARQRRALQAIGVEIENVRAAWRWAISQKNMALIDQAMTSLFHFYDMRSWFLEGEELFRRTADMGRAAVTMIPSDENKVVWGKLLARQGWFTFYLGRQRHAGQLLRESLQVLRPLQQPSVLPFTLNYLGAVEYYLGHYELAQQLCQESLTLTQQLGDQYGAAIANNISGQIAYTLGEYETARYFSQQSLAIEQEIGNRWSMGFSVANLGNVAYALGNFDEANELFRQGLAIAEEMGDPRGIARCLNRLAKSAVALNRYEEAKTLYQRSLGTNQEIGDQLGVTISLSGLGEVARYQGEWQRAKGYFDEALRRAMASHAIPRVIDILQQEASLLAEAGDSSWVEHVNWLADDSQTPYESLTRLVERILGVTI